MSYSKHRPGIWFGIAAIGFVLLMFCSTAVWAQEDTAAKSSDEWELNGLLLVYMAKDYALPMGVFSAAKGHLFLQERYNYEDVKTLSQFGGYRFQGGNKFEYSIIPQIGFLVGRTDAIANDNNIDLSYGSFGLSSEVEFLYNLNFPKLSYIYTWNELTYSPTDWLYVGLTAQRSRIYLTGLDLQRGVVVGGSLGNFTLIGYLFNFLSASHDIFGILGLNYSFQ
ncbi:hypothetical protein [Taibaiella soli]|uniref:Outer membrane protein beta-barrel domain-containing protein n=1 Tax=Taibaiella soli TaxID=1649169 RepID=A0A2W2BIX2_9BACT|nr:hypothetical protein [Taibaiella soli]PZF73396.1 hypothetical protein DN068_08370 [Taibaiella soli]